MNKELKEAEEKLISVHQMLSKYVQGDETKSFKYWHIMGMLDDVIAEVNREGKKDE
ncbi:MAG: hypothetical protein KDH96_00305 [Candidatus Riesia sp.]|nr:hypothetical protein [Candidatus Riesia sp.]